ncbi:cyclic-di-AMP-binding protein CbpB [Tuberibacillus sp. Marseille-P3662]|uniref:cyclic-di-AMP-binding protein CbpB n=1 Tax=Tuberibacillus sp. Marseille-P3662 TaxID=1965358 RepID=UPI000A1C9678|nr:cyclic-di-AMP-binding protein CbpB [Tuberibacillus sp. Marseille-P3662]
MSKLTLGDVMNKKIEDLMIPADHVAHVQMGNPLEHALLVLIKTGYSAIPVLDEAFKLQGIISKTLILDSILGVERIEFEQLSDYIVEKAMNTDPPILNMDKHILDAIKLAINHPFLCVVDEEQMLIGILPRSSLLKLLNHYLRDQDSTVSLS